MGNNTCKQKQCQEYICIALLNSTNKNTLSSLLACLFSSTKLVIKAVQDLPGTEGGREERSGEGGRREK
jgi:hypothetical protein